MALGSIDLCPDHGLVLRPGSAGTDTQYSSSPTWPTVIYSSPVVQNTMYAYMYRMSTAAMSTPGVARLGLLWSAVGVHWADPWDAGFSRTVQVTMFMCKVMHEYLRDVQLLYTYIYIY